MRARYRLGWSRPASHLLEVEMTVEGLSEPSLEVAMPAWIPGAYEILDSARHVSGFEARGRRGALRWRKVDKQTWRIETEGQDSATLRYEVFANTVSCHASSLDESHVHVTGGTVFLYVVDRLEVPCVVELRRPRGWSIATGLEPAGAPDTFAAPSYDVLADSPIEIGAFLHDTFLVRGIPHHVVLHPYGKETKNRARLLKDTKRFVAHFGSMFGGFPYRHYWFLWHLHPTIAKGGALEHLNSTHLTLPMHLDAEDPEEYDRLVDVAAHEFFHLWNVKRIRPRGLGPFDYSKEVHTEALWISEGITDYYAPLGLRRSGVWDDAKFFRHLGRTIDRLLDMPARRTMSLRESSFETWTQAFWHRAYARHDVDSLNQFVDYYTKGALVGMLLDLEIRRRTRGRRSLDDVFRRLLRYAAPLAEGFAEGAFEETASEVAGSDLTPFFRDYVAGTREIDFRRALRAVGLRVRRVPRKKKDDEGRFARKILGSLGLEVEVRGDVRVANAFHGSPAERAGLARGDTLLAADGERVTEKNWRPVLLGKKGRFDLAFFRHDRLLHAPVRPGPDRRQVTRIDLDPAAAAAARALRRGWIGPPTKARAEGPAPEE